jgi:hypothetical protein
MISLIAFTAARETIAPLQQSVKAAKYSTALPRLQV